MASYLFGNTQKAIGAVNGIPVTVRTETSSIFGSKTVVTVGKKELAFNTRRDALEYLRNLEKKPNNNGKGQEK